ncbi:MAG: hypothetical protein U0176_20830 [Bacteroidia bacterium]
MADLVERICPVGEHEELEVVRVPVEEAVLVELLIGRVHKPLKGGVLPLVQEDVADALEQLDAHHGVVLEGFLAGKLLDRVLQQCQELAVTAAPGLPVLGAVDGDGQQVIELPHP